MPITRPNGHSRRSVHVVAVLLAATLTITAACATEEPADLTQPPATSTPQETETSPVASPVATPVETASEDADIVSPPVLPNEPVLSNAAQENSKKGALAFAEYWRELLVYTNLSGNTTTLNGVSDESCKYCSLLIQEKAEHNVSAKVVLEYDLEYNEVPKILESSENLYILEIDATQHSYRVVADPLISKSKESVRFAEEHQLGGLAIFWEEGAWRVYGYGPVQM